MQRFIALGCLEVGEMFTVGLVGLVGWGGGGIYRPTTELPQPRLG